MRLFVAAALPESWKDALDRAARALADQGVRGNFTRRENYHLTLVFLGETDRLDDVIAAMDTVDAPPFPLRTCGVGRFRRSSGDILWVGVQAAPASLRPSGSSPMRWRGLASRWRSAPTGPI